MLPFFLLPYLFLYFIGYAKGAETFPMVATIFAEVDATVLTSVSLVDHFFTSRTDGHDITPHESIVFYSSSVSSWEPHNKLVENLK